MFSSSQPFLSKKIRPHLSMGQKDTTKRDIIVGFVCQTINLVLMLSILTKYKKPMAWRNLGFTRSNPKTRFSNADKWRGRQNVHKFGQKDPRHVPDSHRDFHAQVRILLQELLLIQELEDGIRWQFTIDGVKQDKVHHHYFPILLFMGDTMVHNKLCSLRGGLNAIYVCRICNCPSTHLDEHCTAMTLEDGRD